MLLGGGSPTAAARDAAAAAGLARAGQSPATTRDVKAIAIVHGRARHEVSVATIEELQQTCRATFSIAPQIPLRFVDSLTNDYIGILINYCTNNFSNRVHIVQS